MNYHFFDESKSAAEHLSELRLRGANRRAFIAFLKGMPADRRADWADAFENQGLRRGWQNFTFRGGLYHRTINLGGPDCFTAAHFLRTVARDEGHDRATLAHLEEKGITIKDQPAPARED